MKDRILFYIAEVTITVTIVFVADYFGIKA